MSDDQERRRLREAMDRLLDSQGTRSSGSLSQQALADAAGLKRHYLTHKHTDLWEEFVVRRELQGGVPKNEIQLRKKLATLEKKLDKLEVAHRTLQNDAAILRRMNNVLAVENEALRAASTSTTVARLPGRR